ncbi:MAG TPA: hypothetical protein VI485_14760 [Vicinamibacterales bacterium]|nr:hypothetical protein [Vicinamibacterales bacterium]
MSLDHLHLLLNHVPTVGAAAALGLLLLAFVRRNEHLTHAALEALYVIALLTLPAYISGAGAYRELRNVPGVSDIAVRIHQDVALWGFMFIELAGFVAWLALWQTRRHGRAPRSVIAASTLLLMVAIVIMGRAGNLGGEIRHPEIRSSAAQTAAEGPALDAEAAAEQFVAAAISRFVVYSTWASPAGETVHFLGMSLSIGVLLAVNLRILGVMRQVPFTHVHRLLPWGMLGLGANLVTGMMFFIGTPAQYVGNVPFYWKLGLLMVAGANFLYLTVSRNVWAGDQRGFSLADRAMAVSSIVAWLAILYAGRMLPFLGNAF